jgi:hypothetical protein
MAAGPAGPGAHRRLRRPLTAASAAKVSINRDTVPPTCPRLTIRIRRRPAMGTHVEQRGVTSQLPPSGTGLARNVSLGGGAQGPRKYGKALGTGREPSLSDEVICTYGRLGTCSAPTSSASSRTSSPPTWPELNPPRAGVDSPLELIKIRLLDLVARAGQ